MFDEITSSLSVPMVERLVQDERVLDGFIRNLRSIYDKPWLDPILREIPRREETTEVFLSTYTEVAERLESEWKREERIVALLTTVLNSGQHARCIAEYSGSRGIRELLSVSAVENLVQDERALLLFVENLYEIYREPWVDPILREIPKHEEAAELFLSEYFKERFSRRGAWVDEVLEEIERSGIRVRGEVKESTLDFVNGILDQHGVGGSLDSTISSYEGMNRDRIIEKGVFLCREKCLLTLFIFLMIL